MSKFSSVILLASVLGFAHNTPISYRPRVNKSPKELMKNKGSDKEQERRWLNAEYKRIRKRTINQSNAENGGFN